MPLEKYYTQSLTFSGAGTGADTMTIAVGGVTLDVAISNLLTASQAADLFRTEALDNGTFVTDVLGSGATVTLYSTDGGVPSQVTISSVDPQTVSGIVATGGTLTEISIPMVESLTAQAAAAYLLMAEYGMEQQDTDKDGAKFLALVREILEKIRDKKEKLFDFAGVELSRSTTKSLSFFARDGSVDANGEALSNKFTINQRF